MGEAVLKKKTLNFVPLLVNQQIPENGQKWPTVIDSIQFRKVIIIIQRNKYTFMQNFRIMRLFFCVYIFSNLESDYNCRLILLTQIAFLV